MNWERRYNIICGIPRGILYLHEDSRLKIIHRDLKPSNVLLDEEMNPKISDFGLARLFDAGQSQDKTCRRVGTYGYMALEYISHGHYSAKSDVFSFGILVLEIVSGKKKSWLWNTDDVELLIRYAWTNWREGTASNLIDQTLGDGSRSEIMRCIHIGLLCVQENVAYRPTVASVVQMLSSHCSSLPTPARPAFLISSDIERDITLLESTSGASESEQSKDRDGTAYLLLVPFSMCNSSLITIVRAFLISLSLCLPLAVAQPKSCSNTGTFSNNSTYASNLNLLLSSLPSNVTANGGFYNTSAGQDPNKVYALALCRGDLDTGKCYTCTNISSQDITKQCPDQKEAIIWGAECILRYSNRNIFGTMEDLPSQCVPNPNNISSADLDQFNQTLYNLMGSLGTQASLGSSSKKYFAVGDKSFSSSRNVYGLVQCTPDISQMDCRICLEGAVANISSCSGGKEGGRVLKPSCIAWFEVFQFYDSTFVPSSPTTPVIPPTSDNSSPTKTSRGNSSTSRLVFFVVVPIAGLMTLITLAWAILRKKKSKQNVDSKLYMLHYLLVKVDKIKNDDATKRLEALKFNFSTIKAATNNFSNANKIGEGGFGSVYKAWTNWREGTASNLIDQTLGDGSRSEITRCIHIGLLCVQENVAYRPTMASVVQMLNSDSSSLPTPARPAFLIHSDIERDSNLPESTSGASKSK
ncbi:hypothetical protein SO802_026764 [Lithocarpus litseifolius]|uniref:Cysteine-rich receptor-like protein kinase 25 n=1 Tax=Lithocarpus litseifolius TaxID=425828 RepID=A0AAW2C0P5_9ROSI